MARRFLADCRGVTAIEFAFVAPVFLLLVATVVEAGLVFSGNMALDAGARAAARYGLTGQETADATRTSTLRRLIAERVCPRALDTERGGLCYWAADGPMSTDEAGHPTPLEMTLEVFRDPRNMGLPEPYEDVAPENNLYDPGESFDDVNGNGVWDADTGRAGPGGPGDVVVYEVAIHQALTTPLLRATAGGRFIRHEARVVIRNEPY